MADRPVSGLPCALEYRAEIERRMGGRPPAVFLDYDGTLTPIVENPEEAVISGSMREVVRSLARRCPVCVVSGRDRRTVQRLMGLEDLVVAGSHGFDIWSPERGEIGHEASAGYEGLIGEVEGRLREELRGIGGVVIEPKRASVAVHYRHVAAEGRPRVREVVDALLASRPGELKVTPGKMVYEVQPNLEWDKGRAVLYLIQTLGLEDDFPIYLGDDVTDEDAFRALSGRGVGIYVGEPDDPEAAGRTTAADYLLRSVDEVERFLDSLAR